jgi:hypothetical protein
VALEAAIPGDGYLVLLAFLINVDRSVLVMVGDVVAEDVMARPLE